MRASRLSSGAVARRGPRPDFALTVAGLLCGDNQIARLEIAADDLVKVSSSSPSHDRYGYRLAVAQDPDLAVRSRAPARRRARHAARHVTQRLVRNAEHVVALIDDDARCGGHARHQREVGIVDADHDIEGHDVLDGLRRLADLTNRAFEDALREGVDRKGCLVSLLDAADVAFADIGVDLHLGEVGGDQKQRRRLEACGDRLTHGDIARHHRAVDRRNDVRIVEIDLRRVECGLA